jgi:regulator of RNase E activity RraA
VIQELGFPVFLQGARPVNISGRSTGVSHGWLVEVDDLRVEPGDIVFAAIDGSP